MTVLKISLGVFIGLTAFALAAFVVVRAPEWMKESRESTAWQSIGMITPEEVISRCGKPDKDWLDSSSARSRFLSYKSESQYEPVVIEFARNNDAKWLFSGFDSGEIDAEIGYFKKHPTPASQLAALPCLKGK